MEKKPKVDPKVFRKSMGLVPDKNNVVSMNDISSAMTECSKQIRGMKTVKIKPLNWIKRDDVIAYSPASTQGYFLIMEPEGEFWGCWSGAPNEGFDDIEVLKKHAQDIHDAYIMGFIEP